ncbi:hypothetical protein, partial [Candidatus Symbiopectobacterium sp.]|uniref:hypothetical protein n=1 Tax=Candidatus Symbiopectobacterium sp. TaxID=2816440 RepID=UPI0025C13847
GHFCHNRFFHRRCLFTKRASYINFSHCIPHPKPDISHCNQHIEYTTLLMNRCGLIMGRIPPFVSTISALLCLVAPCCIRFL